MITRPQLPQEPLVILTAQTDRDGVYWKSAQASNCSLTNTQIIMSGGRAGVISDMSPVFTNPILRDVLITVNKGDKAITMWGVRRHMLRNPVTTRVRVVDTTRPDAPTTNMKEHAIYDEIESGIAVYESCSGKNIPAQLLQIRLAGNRSDPKWTNARQIIVNSIHGDEVGQLRGAGRAAFAVSIKDSGPNGIVELRDPFLRTIQQTNVAKRSDGTWADSFAAVCIEYCKSLTWTGGYIGYKNPKMTSVQLFDFANKSNKQTGPEEISIDGVTFDHNNGICLRLDDTTKKVDIRNCTGSGEITIFKMATDGVYRVWKKVPLSQGFTF
jgi:hypothetical protein